MTTQQLNMHALNQPPSPPRVFLKEAGFQEGFGNLPGRMLYNVVGGDYMVGSTVTMETMVAQGFKVEIIK